MHLHRTIPKEEYLLVVQTAPKSLMLMSSPLRGITKALQTMKTISRLRKRRSYLASRRRIGRHPSDTNAVGGGGAGSVLTMPSDAVGSIRWLRQPGGVHALFTLNPPKGSTRTPDRNGRVDDGEKMWASVKVVGVLTRLTSSQLRLKRLFAQNALRRLGSRIYLPSGSATGSNPPALFFFEPPACFPATLLTEHCSPPRPSLQHMRSCRITR